MDMTPREYQQYVQRKMKKSPLGKDVCLAFFVGGAICVLGQVILDGWMSLGLPKEDAGTATSCSLVALSSLLTGLNLYNKLARFGGAGTLVPITGDLRRDPDAVEMIGGGKIAYLNRTPLTWGCLGGSVRRIHLS